VINVKALKYDPDTIKSSVKQVGNSLVFLKSGKVHIPERYLAAGLINISDSVTMLAIFGIIVGDRFAVSVADAMCVTKPSNITTVSVDGVNYYELQYEKGDQLFTNISLVVMNTLINQIYQEIYSKGNVPWYISYDLISSIFDTSEIHANAFLNTDNAIIELMASVIARDRKDKRVYFRHSESIDKGVRPIYIPLSSVSYQATNTFTKIGGGYFNEGLTSALVTPSESNEAVEVLLRT